MHIGYTKYSCLLFEKQNYSEAGVIGGWGQGLLQTSPRSLMNIDGLTMNDKPVPLCLL